MFMMFIQFIALLIFFCNVKQPRLKTFAHVDNLFFSFRMFFASAAMNSLTESFFTTASI